MELRRCGNTELLLSKLGAGCWAFGGGDYWGEQNQRDVNRVVRRAVELGINYFDTAEAYNNGRSEKALGEAIRGIPRDGVLIGTKISPCNTKPDVLKKHCTDSLNRLQTDYIDLYMVHWPISPQSIQHFTNDYSLINNPPELDDAFFTLNKLKEQGKIRYIGVSNFGLERLNEAREFADIVVNELPYSLLARAIEHEILPYSKQNKIGVIGYMTLLQGILADIYPTLEDVPKWQRRTRHFSADNNHLTRHGEAGAEQETNEALEGIRIIMQEVGISMPAIAIKWALAQENLTCALVGARTVEELEENVKAANEPLDPLIVEELNAVTFPLKEKLGKSFDYYESVENDRTE